MRPLEWEERLSEWDGRVRAGTAGANNEGEAASDPKSGGDSGE